MEKEIRKEVDEAIAQAKVMIKIANVLYLSSSMAFASNKLDVILRY